MDYEQMFQRNGGYIPKELQKKVKSCRVLIAGCGMGSAMAEILLRSGFIHLTLVDNDEVDTHNLNRQNFVYDDIHEKKTSALADRLRKICPLAKIEEKKCFINNENVESVLENIDIVIDTVDFIDLPGVVSLYDEAQKRAIPVISVINAGYGAVALFYSHRPMAPSFRHVFGLPLEGSVASIAYDEKYQAVLEKLTPYLHPMIITEMGRALQVMSDGKPCPASQIAPGSYSAGALASTILLRYLAGEKLHEVPHVIILDLFKTIFQSVVSLG